MPSHTPTRVRTVLIASAVAAAGFAFALPPLVRGQTTPASGAAAPAAPAAPAPLHVPVKAVVLFSSGVGYFEHFGTVTGDGAAEIRFKTAQVNDVLKSLVVQDLDGGKAGTVSYASQEPLGRTLKSFQVDITENPPLADLLNQLRGASLTVTLPGGVKETGLILGVEHRTTSKNVGGEAKTETHPYLNLKVGRRVRAIPLEDAQEWQLEDPQLDAELDRALSAVAGARGQDKKPVTINFRGQGDRRVRLGYVVEAPIWKTSYRLVLSDPAGAPRGDRAAAAPPQANGAAAAANPANGGGYLQGWAIIENQTDNDWDNVQLSLVSGRPISFIQDLYNPLYVPRPIIRPELYASLRPQTYAGGITDEEAEELRMKADASQERFRDAPNFSLQSTRKGGGGGGQGLFGNSDADEALKTAEEPLDPTASVRSIASAGRIGELFQYTVGNVSIARQKSAMIPIVTEPLQVERLSIYNASVLQQHPLNGARVKNTTKNHLLQGPITVLEAGAYAGDARIDDLPPGQERLISFGVDLDTHVVVESADDADQNGNSNENGGNIVTAKIANGFLQVTHKQVHAWTYTAQNKGTADKTLLIEHPKMGDEPASTLVEPAKVDETTQELYRFGRPLKAGATLKIPVRIEEIVVQGMQLAEVQGELAMTYLSTGAIPKSVRDALAKAVDLSKAVEKATVDAANLRKRVEGIRKEQASLRENMKAVAPGTDYYNRLAAKLDAQETEVERLQSQADATEQTRARARDELEAFVKGLNVG